MNIQKVTNKILFVDNFSDRFEYISPLSVKRLIHEEGLEDDDFKLESEKIFTMQSNFYFFQYLKYCEVDFIDVVRNNGGETVHSNDTSLMTGLLFTKSSDTSNINIENLKLNCRENRFIIFPSILNYVIGPLDNEIIYLKFFIEKTKGKWHQN